LLIGKVRGVPSAGAGAARLADRANRDRRADAAVRLERPHDAAGPRVERVDDSVLAADEQPSAGDGRLRPGRCRVRKAERPLQTKARHLLGGEAGVIAWLKCVFVTDGAHPFQRAPLVGSVSGIRVRGRRGPTTMRAGFVRSGIPQPPGVRPAQALVAHRSGREASTIACGERPPSRRAPRARGSSPLWHDRQIDRTAPHRPAAVPSSVARGDGNTHEERHEKENGGNGDTD
jgi:hypothetical protein